MLQGMLTVVPSGTIHLALKYGWIARAIWLACLVLLIMLVAKARSLVNVEAPHPPSPEDLAAIAAPDSERSSELAVAAPARAAGSNTLSDVARNSWRARDWHPEGDPAADFAALLAGQAFRVTALLRDDNGWRRGKLYIEGRPLTLTWWRSSPAASAARCLPLESPSNILLARKVDMKLDRFQQTNDWLYTIVTIGTRGGREVFAIPTLDVPLVHAALELANVEAPAHQLDDHSHSRSTINVSK